MNLCQIWISLIQSQLKTIVNSQSLFEFGIRLKNILFVSIQGESSH